MIQDFAARQLALSPEQSFIVQAPAGSGKTGLLVYRVLTLLAKVEQPQQVLAITFTRKATAEMRERVLELLRAATLGESSADQFEQQGIDLAAAVLEQDRRFNWQLLNAPHQLQILTIDSFCAKLTGSMPWLSRLGDRPRTTDQAGAHYAAAVEQLLSELLDETSVVSAHLQTVMLELDFNYNKARHLFSSMLAQRDQWLRHLLQNDLTEMRQALEAAWQEVVDSQLSLLTEKVPQASWSQLLSLAQEASGKLRPKPGKPSALSAFEDWSPGQEIRIEHYHALCFLLLTATGTFRKTVNITQGFEAKSATKDQMRTLLKEFAGDFELLELLVEIRNLPNPNYSTADWAQLTALEAVLKSLAALLQLRFRSVGECDHSEVTQRANLALQELDSPTDLGLRMDYHLQHIMVDEFQDTSHGQIELLKKLTAGWSVGDGKTLFLVGDPMQSIYRFREADVSLFLQVAENELTGVFSNISIQSLNLTENFRSSNSLVTWFNEVFDHSFPAASNVLNGAITYAPASCRKDDQYDAVEYLLAHDRQQESELLVAAVKKAINELPTERDQVAVLVRSRPALESLLPALQQAGIEYTGVDISPLRELQAVVDTLALCKAICRDDDRVAWLSLLRGPWCGLTLSEIKLLVGDTERTVWQQLCDDGRATLLGDSEDRLMRFITVMQAVLSQRQQVPLGSLTRWAWLNLGGADTLYGASRDDLEKVFELIEELQRGGDLSSMRDLDNALNGLFARPSIGQSRLVVSTMHKSKGLQYHTVLLPSLDRTPRSNDKEVLMWAEYQAAKGESKLLLAPFTMISKEQNHYQYLRQLENKRSVNEAIRLMYVACTRAEHKLVLLASARTNEDTGDLRAPIKSSLLHTVWAEVQTHFDFALEKASEVQVEQSINQTLSRLPAAYTPLFSESFEWQVSQQINAEQSQVEPNIEYDWATRVATGVGIVLHDWLQYNGANVLDVNVDVKLRNRWRAELLALQVPADRVDIGVRRVAKAVANIQADSAAHFLFADYPIAENEYAVSAFEGGSVNKYRIDRSFIDEQGVRWIVDYKSTDTKTADVDAFIDEQVQTRHRAQLEKYGALLRELDRTEYADVPPIKLAVYFPLLKQLRTWDYKP